MHSLRAKLKSIQKTPSSKPNAFLTHGCSTLYPEPPMVLPTSTICYKRIKTISHTSANCSRTCCVIIFLNTAFKSSNVHTINRSLSRVKKRIYRSARGEKMQTVISEALSFFCIFYHRIHVSSLPDISATAALRLSFFQNCLRRSKVIIISLFSIKPSFCGVIFKPTIRLINILL